LGSRCPDADSTATVTVTVTVNSALSNLQIASMPKSAKPTTSAWRKALDIKYAEPPTAIGWALFCLVHVPFNCGGPLQNALVGNQVSSGIDTLVDQIELYRSGKTRILATSAATLSPLLADAPTFAESGLKGVEGTSWFAVYAPAKTPAATIQQTNAAFN
jgi:tripartite-type tricarboxylate transporter receptor subunit TctC